MGKSTWNVHTNQFWETHVLRHLFPPGKVSPPHAVHRSRLTGHAGDVCDKTGDASVHRSGRPSGSLKISDLGRGHQCGPNPNDTRAPVSVVSVASPKKIPKNRCLLAIQRAFRWFFSVFDINISSNLGVCQSLAAASDRHTGSTIIWKLDLALYKLPLTQVQALQQTSRHQKQSMNVKKHGALPGKPETPEWRKGIPE